MFKQNLDAENQRITKVFDNVLWEDVKNTKTYLHSLPLLAHYTSIEALEKIMKGDELWFSNPFYMNDKEEWEFGVRESAALFREHVGVRMACPEETYKHLRVNFEFLLDEFNKKDAFDTYVFCMTQHDGTPDDGMLSMWRGYGSNGNGVAIIFDTSKISYDQNVGFLLLSSVQYYSPAARRAWVNAKLSEFSEVLRKENLPTDKLYLALHSLFERLKMFALFAKHDGFGEEREWRAVYLTDYDGDNKLQKMLGYAMGPHGIEPKFKLKVGPIDGITDQNFLLEKMVSKIILGPSVSSPIAKMCVERMLKTCNKQELVNKVTNSTIPFRALSNRWQSD